MTDRESADLRRIDAKVDELDEKVDRLITDGARADARREHQTDSLARVEARLDDLARSRAADRSDDADWRALVSTRLDTLSAGRRWSPAELSGLGGLAASVLGGLSALVYALAGKAPVVPLVPPSPIEVEEAAGDVDEAAP